MNVTSYLEAFLTIYGWEFYYILFLLLMPYYSLPF